MPVARPLPGHFHPRRGEVEHRRRCSIGGAGEVVAGMREMANLAIGDEMVAMLIARRAYSASARSVQAIDEMLQQANTLNA